MYSYYRCNCFVFFLCSMIFYSPCLALSFDSISAFFGAHVYQTIYDKEYHLENPGILCINNRNGNITIKTTWKQNTIRLKAIIESSDEKIKNFTIQEHLTMQHNKTNLTLSSSEIKGRIHYELIIPASIELQLNTEHGSIIVNEANDHELKGAISVTTTQGSIEIYNCSKTITAQTKNGSITIKHAHNIHAHTQAGDIIITDSIGSVIAHTEKGDITTTCIKVPNTSRIQLSTESGTLLLTLPSITNATVQGKTSHGLIICEHYITLKPQKTKLNTLAWQRFKKEVFGTIGTGEADIILSNEHGNIKILETI